MATPQQLAQSVEALMTQLNNNSISFSQYVSSIQSIKSDFERQSVNFSSDENENYSYIISKAISLSLGEDPNA